MRWVLPEPVRSRVAAAGTAAVAADPAVAPRAAAAAAILAAAAAPPPAPPSSPPPQPKVVGPPLVILGSLTFAADMESCTPNFRQGVEGAIVKTLDDDARDLATAFRIASPARSCSSTT